MGGGSLTTPIPGSRPEAEPGGSRSATLEGMPRTLDADETLIRQMLAPPPVEDARRSVEFWTARRRSLPLYRRAARREAQMMAARWHERLREAEQARFDASWLGRMLAGLGLSRYWPTRPGLDARMLVRTGWRWAPPQVKLVAAWAAALSLASLALIAALLFVALAQLV